MGENILVCLVGLPYSGKSTMAHRLGCPIVNRDSVRLALHGERFIPEAEEMVAAVTKLMVKALFLAGHSKVVVDETNTTKKRRNSWRSNEWRTKFLHVDTPKEECIRRAEAVGDTVILPIIEKMSGQFEPLDGDEERLP